MRQTSAVAIMCLLATGGGSAQAPQQKGGGNETGHNKLFDPR